MGLMTTIFAPRVGAISESELRGAEAWLLDTGDVGAMSTAGVRVSETNVITLSGVFAAARAVAEDVACLPLKAYRRLEPKGKEVASGEPKYPNAEGRPINLHNLVHEVPNVDMTDLEFRSLMIWWAQIWGNAYAEIERDTAGRPIAMIPRHPHTVRVDRDETDRLFYRLKRQVAEPEVDIPKRDMVHVKGISDDGLTGLMIAKVGRDAFGIYLAAERYSGRFFGRGAMLGGVVSFPDKGKFTTKEAMQQYREDFNRIYGNAGEGHQWMITDDGADVKVTGAKPEEAQLSDTVKFRLEDVARWFRVPPVIIGHNTSTPYTNVESLGMFYTKFAMGPWAKRVQKELTRKLVPVGRDDLFVEHVIDALMWADSKVRAEFHNIGIRGGWKTPNEARDQENMNPYEGGDRFRVEQNLAVLDEDGNPVPANDNQPENDPEPDPGDAAGQEDGEEGQTAVTGVGGANRRGIEAYKALMMPVFVDAAERMIAREAKAIMGRKTVTPQWLAKFYRGHHAEVAAAFRPAINTLASLVSSDASGIADRYADAHVGESGRRLETGEDPESWIAERPAWIAKHLTDEVCNERCDD